MRYGVIFNLCRKINARRGLTYPAIGYLYYANVKGDGRTNKSVYAIINAQGGVTVVHNGATSRQTAQNLRTLLETLKSC